LVELNPYRGVVAQFIPTTHTVIYPRPHQAAGQRRTQQKMVDAQAGIPGESIFGNGARLCEREALITTLLEEERCQR
jgi:hypothetical protein